MPERKPTDDRPVSRKKYASAFKAECVRQVAAGARQSDVAYAQGISPTLLGRWQWAALEQAIPSSAEREEIKRLRTELKRVKTERDILKNRLPSSHCLSCEQVRVYQEARRHAGRQWPVPGTRGEL
jgi:transposase